MTTNSAAFDHFPLINEPDINRRLMVSLPSVDASTAAAPAKRVQMARVPLDANSRNAFIDGCLALGFKVVDVQPLLRKYGHRCLTYYGLQGWNPNPSTPGTRRWFMHTLEAALK